MYTEIAKTRKTDQLFNLIRTIQQLDLSRCLKIILDEKRIEVIKLHQILQDQGYMINRESLYRYFNPSPKSRRYPSLDFIDAFSVALRLNQQEAELLRSLWSYCRLLKKLSNQEQLPIVSKNLINTDKSNFDLFLDIHNVNL